MSIISRNFEFILLTIVICITIGLFVSASSPNGNVITLDLVGPDGTGTVLITNKENCPDKLRVIVDNLLPNTVYTVFLTNSPTLGALPAQFLGQFQTNSQGKATFKATTEVVNAFASANVNLQNELGIADVVAAGALGLGANTIPLDWVRVYVGVGDISVFGTSENNIGGGLALTSTTAIP